MKNKKKILKEIMGCFRPNPSTNSFKL